MPQSLGPDFSLQADAETDEVYAQMTLQPLSPVCDIGLIMFVYACFISTMFFY